MKTIFAVVIISSTALLSGCAGGSVNNDVSYGTYGPGYTGYTVGYGGYGNGYGPSVWSPGYYNYAGYGTGYNRGYRGVNYGAYRGGYAHGVHGGYHR